MVEAGFNWFEIIQRVLAIAGPIVAIYLGTIGANVYKAVKKLVEEAKAAWEDEKITPEEWNALIMGGLDILVAALPWFVKGKRSGFSGAFKIK